MTITAEIDTETLPPEEAREIAAMVETADFFELPKALVTSAPGADRFQYELAVSDEGRSHAVSLNDGAVPERLRPLLNRLSRIARPARNGSKR